MTTQFVLFQFEKPVLEVALSLLDKGELAADGRSSVVSVIRCLSALVCNSYFPLTILAHTYL